MGNNKVQTTECRGCPGVPVHEGIPFVFITIHGVMTQFVNVSFFCVPVHEDTTEVYFSNFVKSNFLFQFAVFSVEKSLKALW